MGPAAARVLGEQVSASTTILPFVAASNAAARQLNANKTIEGYYTNEAGRVVFRAVVRDLATNRNAQWLEFSGKGDSLLAAAASFAQQIDKRNRAFGTRNPAALQAWGQSLVEADPQHRAELLEKAIAADASFGAAYLDLAQLHASTGQGPRALEVAKRARERISSFTDFDRARMDLFDANLTNNADQRRTALVALSRLVSTDADTIRTLAESEMAARRFSAAADLYRNAVALEPENPGLLNALGYAEAYGGRLDAAREDLERYRALDPKALNPVDSLGEVCFIAGDFGEAARYFLEAEKLQPGPASTLQVLKAAQARFLGNDVRGADELRDRAFKAMGPAGAALAGLQRAQWFWITGRKQEATTAAERIVAAPQPDAAAYAGLQLALWKLDGGDREGARSLATAAVARASNPRIKRLAAIVVSITGGAVPDLDPVAATIARAYTAFFARDFAKAAELFNGLYLRSEPSNDGAFRTMLAYALNQTGKKDQLRELTSRYFIPIGSTEEAPLAVHALPYFVELRRSLGR